MGIIRVAERCQVHPQACNPLCNPDIYIRWAQESNPCARLLHWEMLRDSRFIRCAEPRLHLEPERVRRKLYRIEGVAHVKTHSDGVGS